MKEQERGPAQLSAVPSSDLVEHYSEVALPSTWSRRDSNEVNGKAVVQTSSRFESDP